MSKKKEFLNEFDNKEIGHITVYVNMPDCPAYEIITNPRDNFQAKKDYYDKAYNDNLELKSFPKITIDKWDLGHYDYSKELEKEVKNEN